MSSGSGPGPPPGQATRDDERTDDLALFRSTYLPSLVSEEVLADNHRPLSYRSLIPLAHDARRPMFDLRAADGAIGSTQSYVQKCLRDFKQLARTLVARVEEVTGRPVGIQSE
ncbi:hypothetical protein [Actinoalloteichus sp. GBA129-24]|uniref:hypothetical protein n=1 Tax=Actinoalloteichus sp. GBA129-24 TaxID=1612551 RepID=UPI000950B663|nr:hypothetical protein [Actinoalloteichus sp. GBA129-24]APU19304.1 hypothetical protein UA75_06405 [Actinoalloteichus sp. GBA129-24]